MKKKYVKPEIVIVQLHSRQQLLTGSVEVRGRSVYDEYANENDETL